MIFCPNCETKLILTQDKQGSDTALEYRCPKCGYTNYNSPGLRDHEVIKSKTREEAIIVFGKEELELRNVQTNRAECPKCHNYLAYVWQVQTRSGDEGPTQFFRCTKCSYTWRLYT